MNVWLVLLVVIIGQQWIIHRLISRTIPVDSRTRQLAEIGWTAIGIPSWEAYSENRYLRNKTLKWMENEDMSRKKLQRALSAVLLFVLVVVGLAVTTIMPALAQDVVPTAVVGALPPDEPVQVFAQQIVEDIDRQDLLSNDEIILTTTELMLMIIGTAGGAFMVGGGGALYFLKSLLNSKSIVDLFEKLYKSTPTDLQEGVTKVLKELSEVVTGLQRATDGLPNDDLLKREEIKKQLNSVGGVLMPETTKPPEIDTNYSGTYTEDEWESKG